MREKSEKVFTKRELKEECRLNGGFWSSALEVLHFMRWIFFFFIMCLLYWFQNLCETACPHSQLVLDSYMDTSLRACLWII